MTSVFYDMFGYHCFYLEKPLSIGTLYWYPDKRKFMLAPTKSHQVDVGGVKEAQLLITIYDKP